MAFKLPNFPNFSLSVRNAILISIGVLIIVGILIFVIGWREDIGKEKVVLNVWGVFDNARDYEELFGLYKKQFPNVEIKYKEAPFENYEKELINAFSDRQEPDIWMMQNTWLPKHNSKISPMPATIMNFREFQDAFMDVAVKDLTQDGKIYALPLYVDTLALFYDKSAFASAGIASPPKTWEDFKDTVRKLTIFDDFGNIARSGAAIGAAKNINRSVDILYLLMLQSGAEMVDKGKTRAVFDQSVSSGQGLFSPGETALQFYTDFADPAKSVYTWDSNLFYSIDAFFTGRTAMMINYAHNIETIKDKAPHLNFGIAPAPQIKDSSKDPSYSNINYANYWAYTVSKNSLRKEEAWKLLKFLSEYENDARYALAVRRPVARKDLVVWQKDDSELGVFAEQTLSANSWYQADNVAIEKIFIDAIELVNLKKQLPREAIRRAAEQVNAIMQR